MPDPILVAFGIGTLFGLVLTFTILFVTYPGGRSGYQPIGPGGPKNPPRGGSSAKRGIGNKWNEAKP